MESSTETRPGFEWLVGGGEMGERIRALDWSKTPLGPAETWSPALRMMLRVMLANRFPMALWWGPEYVSIYNDAYRPVLGTKHPAALSQPARQCWEEVWPTVGPRLDALFGGGPSVWNDDYLSELNRRGFREEARFAFSNSPVPDDSVPGGIGGVLATVHEITDKILGDRRLTVLRDLGLRSTEAKTAEEACEVAARTLADHARDIPFAMIYLLDPDRKTARLSGVAGASAGDPVAPIVVSTAGNGVEDSLWPFAEVARRGDCELVRDLAARLGDRVPRGPWSDPPREAVVVPIPSSKDNHPMGFLVAGLSPRLAFDDPYREFLTMVATQIAASISNAREYEAERKRAEALAEIDRAKTTFFSNISHEFRTPLTLILGPIEELMASARTELPAHLLNRVEVAYRNSLRLLRLVNRLLDFSRVEAGRARATYEPVDLSAFTVELASVFQAATDRAGLGLVVDCPPLPEPVWVDRDMWEKIVLNLISNAFKFTFEGRIAVTLRVVDGEVELQVSDTGVGIPAEELPRVFERFHRSTGTRGRTHEGSGIGLALVQELVKLHGGSVRVESRVDEGSCFFVRLPLGNRHLPPEGLKVDPAKRGMPSRPTAFVEEALGWLPDGAGADRSLSSTSARGIAGDDRRKILVVDDNTDMLRYLTHILADEYVVRTAVDGVQALEIAREERPELILSDIMMPKLDGIGLLRSLREDPALKTVPVIFLTARAGEESRVKGLTEGADDYLTKPFSARELRARVKSRLELIRLRAESKQAIEESETRFRTLVRASSDTIYRMSADWSELLQVWGRNGFAESVEPTRDWLRDHIPEEDHPRVAAATEQAVRTGTIFDLEHRFRRADGSIGWTRSRAVPILDERGEIVEWFGMASDITQRREAELQVARDLDAMTRLRELAGLPSRGESIQTLLDRIVETALAIADADFGGIQLLDPTTGALRIVNQRGFSSRWVSYWNSDAPNKGTGACGAALTRHERVIVEDVEASPIFQGTPSLEVLREEGVRAVQSTPLVGWTGTIVGIFSTHFRTPRRPDDRTLALLDLLARQAADALEQMRAEAALRESRERLSAILNTAADAIITVGYDGTIRSVNPAAERMFGYTAAEMVGRHGSMLLPTDYPALPDGVPDLFPRTVLHDSLGVVGETLARRESGELFPIEAAISQIPQLQLHVGICRDLTERRRMERELVEIATQTQRAIGQDLHDTVAQALVALNLMAGVLAETLDPASPGARLAVQMARELHRTQEDLRVVLRGLLPVAVDGGGLMAALTDLAARVVKQHRTACEFDCPVPVEFADNATATQLYLIAQEAVLNALKHGKPRNVSIGLHSMSGFTILRVADDGIGMSTRSEGTGFGLRIMRGRAAIVGAELSIEPGVNGGTVVTCTLLSKGTTT